MPLKVVPPRIGKTPFYSVRGTYLGVHVDRSTKTASRSTAAKFLKLWKEEIERGAVSRPGEPTFLDAAVKYMAATGQERFLDRIVDRIGDKPVRLVDQAVMDELAIALYPTATPATRNRQLYTPISAVLKHAGATWETKRPAGWRGERRTHFLFPEQAFRVFEAADDEDLEFGLFLRFLTYTGARLSEATRRLTINGLSLADELAIFAKTKNEDQRPVYLPPVLVAALAGHPRGLDRPGKAVFRFRKNGRLYVLLGRVRKAVGPAVEIEGFHTFRHTWGAWMRQYGGLDTSGLVATKAWRDAESARRYEHVIAPTEAKKAILLPVEKAWTARLRIGISNKIKAR